MSSSLLQLLPGTKIVLYGEEPGVDVLTLGRALGYKEIGRLRRQILTEWSRKGFFEIDRDFVVEHLMAARKDYLALAGFEREPIDYALEDFVLLTERGMARLFERTTKPSKAAIEIAWGVWIDSRPVVATSEPESFAERRFRHSVMRGLFRDLLAAQTITGDPKMEFRKFAIEIAESALGETLSEPRSRFLPKETPPAASPSVPARPIPTERRATTVAPTAPALFNRDGYYTLSDIGEMAGGYSAVTAGMAANLVAEAQNISAAQLRRQELGFNQIKTVNVGGHHRAVVRFNRDFSNKVVVELRRNVRFKKKAPSKEFFQVAGFGGTPENRVDLRSPVLSLDDV